MVGQLYREEPVVLRDRGGAVRLVVQQVDQGTDADPLWRAVDYQGEELERFETDSAFKMVGSRDGSARLSSGGP